MLESYKDIADSVGLLADWKAIKLFEESELVRVTCNDAAEAINELYKRLVAYEDAKEEGMLVEVVRCHECVYRDYDDAPYGEKVAVCTGAMAYSQTPDDWYCPMGKRKDGGQDE